MNRSWSRFWMRASELGPLKKVSTRLATLGVPPDRGRVQLAYMNRRGYISVNAKIHHSQLSIGGNAFIDDGVEIFQAMGGYHVDIGDKVCIYRDTIIETGQGGSIKIGHRSSIHPRCVIYSYVKPIHIGNDVMIAANCAFYPYDHGTTVSIPIIDQPLQSKGGITIKNGAWLGFGVIVLSGVTIGEGAVISAGSLVTNDVPDNGVAAGVPAKIVKMRSHIK